MHQVKEHEPYDHPQEEDKKHKSAYWLFYNIIISQGR